MFRHNGCLHGKVAVIGACGAVGRIVSLLLRCSPTVADLRLVDCSVDEGAKGVAEDLSHIEFCTYHYQCYKSTNSKCNDSAKELGTSGNICSSGHGKRVGDATPQKDTVMSSQENSESNFHQKKVTGYGMNDIEAALAGVDVVVSAAGRGRTKGMKSFDKLFEHNADVAINVATAVGKYAPPGVFFGLTTSPLNCILPVTAEALKAVGAYSPQRLFGMTALHTARARCYYRRETGRAPGKGLVVIGGQTGQTIVPLFSQAEDFPSLFSDTPHQTNAKRRLTKMGTTTLVEEGKCEGNCGEPLSAEMIEHLTIRVQEAGALITKYDQPSSFACAHSCREWAESVLPILTGEIEETVLTAVVESTLFPSCKFFGSPVVVGREGVKSILPLPPLASYEEELLDRCLPDLETNIKRGLAYYKRKNTK